MFYHGDDISPFPHVNKLLINTSTYSQLIYACVFFSTKTSEGILVFPDRIRALNSLYKICTVFPAPCQIGLVAYAAQDWKQNESNGSTRHGTATRKLSLTDVLLQINLPAHEQLFWRWCWGMRLIWNNYSPGWAKLASLIPKAAADWERGHFKKQPGVIAF